MDDTSEIRSADLQTTITKYLPFLLEIRKRIFFIVAIFFIAGAIGFFYYEKIIQITLRLLNLEGVNIVFTSPFQFMDLALNCAIVLGIVAVFPLIIAQFLSFLRPALRSKEFKLLTSLLPLSLILFVFGFIFGVVIMRYVVNLFYAKSLELNIGNFLDISKLLSQILVTSSLLGVAFQFPIVMTLLMHFKIIKFRFFASKRPLAYIIAIVFAALMPPTDLLSLFLLTLPLVFLFELTLILNKVFLKTHLL